MSKPDGFFDPKNPAGEATPPETSGRRGRRAGARRAAPAPAGAAGGRRPPPAAAAAAGRAAAVRRRRPRLRQLRPGVQGRQRRDGQLPRLQHLQRRGRPPAQAGGRRSPAPAARATSRSTATCCSCRWSRRAAAIDCGTQGVSHTVSAERFRGVRIFDITDLKNPKQVAAVQTCRGSHTHTLVPTKNDPTNIYVYGSGTGNVRVGRGAGRLLGPRPEGGPEHRALQHRRDQGAAEEPREGGHRRPSAHLRRRDHRRDRRPVGRRRPRPRHPAHQHHQPVPRHHGDARGRPGRRRLLGQRHPDGHLEPGEAHASRPRGRQELRLLALGDVQQRRHQGDLHRRVGRRHAAALPRHRRAQLGRQRHLRHRRQEAGVQGLLQDAGGADRDRELRRAQRLARAGARPRHHGAGLVPGRHLGVRLHRLGQPGRDRLLRPRPDRRRRTSSPAATGRPTGTTAASTAPRSRAASTCSASRPASS